MSSIDAYSSRIEELRSLQENWDTEGAAPPDAFATEAAIQLLKLAESSGLKPSSIDPDVLGGIAINFDNPNGEHVWISLRNGGADCMLLAFGDDVLSARYTKDTWEVVESFLGGNHDVLSSLRINRLRNAVVEAAKAWWGARSFEEQQHTDHALERAVRALEAEENKL